MERGGVVMQETYRLIALFYGHSAAITLEALTAGVELSEGGRNAL